MRLSFTPDLSFQVRLANQNSDIRARLQDVATETVTGRRADTLEASQGRLGEAMRLQSAIGDIDRHLESANLSRARLDGVANAIISMRDSASGFGTTGRIAVAQGNGPALEVVQDDAQNILSRVMSSLNTRVGQRYVFGGTEVAQSPLKAPEVLQEQINSIISAAPDAATAEQDIFDFFGDTTAGFDTQIYNGSTEDGPRLHITDSRSLPPPPNANSAVFRDLMRGLATVAGAANLSPDSERDALMQSAFNTIDQSVDRLLTMEARLGSSQQNLEIIETNLRSERSFLATTEQNIMGRDIFEAAAELQALEGQLQASYTVTGRLGSLSLANFLR